MGFKVIPGQYADFSQAVQDATSYYGGAAGEIELEPGIYNYASQLILNKLRIVGSGMASVLRCTTKLGDGIPSIEAYPDVGGKREVVLEHLKLAGPGVRTLGVKTAQCDGIRLNDQGIISDVRVENFDKGIICNSNGGHITLNRVRTGNNYYGVFFQRDNGGNFITDSDLTGPSFASIGVAGDCYLSGGDAFQMIHLGYGPYGIYQEDDGIWNTKSFITDVLFDRCRFEAIGNAAIYTEKYGNLVGNGINNSKIVDVGFSWSEPQRIASRPRDSAVVVGFSGGTILYEPMISPFKGYGGAKAFQHNSAAVWIGDFDYKDFPSGTIVAPTKMAKVTFNGGNAGGATVYQQVSPEGQTKITVWFTNFRNEAPSSNLDIVFPIPLAAYAGSQPVVTGMNIPGMTYDNTKLTIPQTMTVPYNGFVIIEGIINKLP